MTQSSVLLIRIRPATNNMSNGVSTKAIPYNPTTTTWRVPGEEIQVTNGTNMLIGICTKIQLSGADQIMTLVDPATGSALDLTTVSGGAPSIQPYRVASFTLF